jgi:hypothetical protein
VKVIGNLTKDAIIRAAVSESLTVSSAVDSTAVFLDADISYSKVIFDSSNNKFVVAFKRISDSKGCAVVGTVSGTSISYGSVVEFEQGNTQYIGGTFDSSNNKVVITFRDYDDSIHGKAIVGTVSGTSISFGTAVTFNSAETETTDAVFDSNSNKVVVLYRNVGDSRHGYAIAGTVSGTSISFGAAEEYENARVSGEGIYFDSTYNKIVITYRDHGNSNYGTAIVGSLSGTTLSFGTATVFHSSSTQYTAPSFDTQSGKSVIAFRDGGDSNKGKAIVGIGESGNAITFGTVAIYETSTTTYVSSVFDSNANKVVIGYQDGSDSNYGALVEATISGTSLTFSSAVRANASAVGVNTSLAFDSNSKKVLFSYRDETNSKGRSVLYQVGYTSATGGTIVDGKAVVVNANGTVSTVGITDASIGSAVEFEDSGISYQNSAYDTANDKIVIVYTNTGNSNYLTAVVGTVSGTSVSFGTPVIVNSIQNYFPNIAFDENAGKFVITYSDTGNATHGRAVVATVSGTSITLGSHTSFASHNVQDTFAVYDSAAQKVVIAYRDGTNNNGKAIVGTISGTSITFGSAASFHGATTTAIGIAYDSSNNKIIFAYRDGNNSNQGTAVVGTVSGTSISFGSDAIFETTATQDTHVVYDSGNDKINIFYEDGADSDKLKGVIGTVSGTSISFTSVQELYTDATVSGLAASYDVNAGRTVLSFRGASAYGYALPITSDGSTFTVGSSTIITTNAFGTQTSSVYDPDQKKVVIHYQDGDDSDHGKAQVYVAPASTAGSFVGFMKGAALDGTNGEILSSCSIARNQTSLTPGQTYFVSPTDGSLSLTAGSPSVTAGTAISNTELIVKG